MNDSAGHIWKLYNIPESLLIHRHNNASPPDIIKFARALVLCYNIQDQNVMATTCVEHAELCLLVAAGDADKDWFLLQVTNEHTASSHVTTILQKSPHKFMLTSYMKYFAKFLAILPHNTSYLKIYIICISFCYFIFSKF